LCWLAAVIGDQKSATMKKEDIQDEAKIAKDG